jgi:hypothetical protein
MRIRRPVVLAIGIVLHISLLRGVYAVGVHEKQRVMVLALDCSGSMARSDPNRRRIQAAELLIAAADHDDQVGVIVFGDEPRWLGGKPVTARAQFSFPSLQSVGQSDKHTDFEALLREWNRFLDSEPDGYFETHDVSLVILTDGMPDAQNQSSVENGQAALNLADRAARDSSINVIALGPEPKSDSFLNNLSSKAHGRSAYADTDKELTDAFLRLATSVLHLPAFQKLDTPGKIEDFGAADRSVLVFLGPGSPHLQGAPSILEDGAVKLFDVSRLPSGTFVTWDGAGTVFLCRREHLVFRSEAEFPPAGLLNEPELVSLGLYNGGTDQSRAFFLQNSELQIIARPKFSGPSLTLPFPLGALGKFEGRLALSEPGQYHLSARLRAPYGDLEQSLGDFDASATAVNLPSQLTVRTFPGIPGQMLATKIDLKLLVPIGAADVAISDISGVKVIPLKFSVLPNQGGYISVYASSGSHPTDVIEVPYSVIWKSGSRSDWTNAVLRIAVKRLTVAEAARALWIWLTLFGLILLLVVVALKEYAPRNLRGKLQISREGVVIYSLLMPSDLRTKTLQIKLDRASLSVTRSGSVVGVPSDSDGLLMTIESKRYGGRWTAVVTPGSSRVQASGQNIFGKKAMADVPKSQLVIPAHNLTISFR